MLRGNISAIALFLCLGWLLLASGSENNPETNDVWGIMDDPSVQTLDDETIAIWPFSHHNSSQSASNETDKKNSTQGDKVCADSSTCDVCNSYYTCHWCAHDSSCHAIGSIHGCLIGSTCAKPKPPAHNDTNDPTGCAAHATCSECALASHLCHWCAHDNSCHSVGSVYGCVSGVDCYDNPHCQRTQPEPYSALDAPGIGIGPLVLIVFVAAVAMACATCGCCICSCLKGAYDDLAEMAATSTAEPNTAALLESDQEPPFVDSLMTDEVNVTTTTTNTDLDVAPANAAPTLPEEEQPLLPEPDIAVEPVATENNYQRMMDGDVSPPPRSSRPVTTRTIRHPKRRRFAAMHKLYVACMGCYLCTLLLVGLSAFFAIYFFPKKPIYNICNDSVAWKSLIDSMTSMKATAEFEILASIYNPNHLDVALDMGKGSFSHDGAFVGTYEIPPTYIAANAISDILIVASFTPEKWQALSITAEYYRGTLVMHVDAAATIRIPVLFDYTFSTSLKDIVVHVNEMSDRHLCACPTWSDANNHTLPRLAVPEWVQ